MIKLPFIHKKKKKFLVRLTRRGKVYALGVFEARDHEELLTKITDMLKKDEEIVKEYPKIRIMNLENMQEIAINNPFYQGEEESEGYQHGKSTKSNNLQDLELVANILQATIYKSAELSMTFIGKAMEGVARGLANIAPLLANIKQGKLPEEKEETPHLTLQDIIKLVENIRWIIENRQQVEKAIKESMQSIHEGEKAK